MMTHVYPTNAQRLPDAKILHSKESVFGLCSLLKNANLYFQDYVYRLRYLTIIITINLIFGSSAFSQTTYTWNAGSSSWATTTNWTPTRTTPAANDILIINNGGSKTISNVPTQTIGRLEISGSTNVTFTSSGTTTVTIGN